MNMQDKKALGRGLGSLIPLGNKMDNQSKAYLEIPIEDILPNQNQPRKLFEKESIGELADSIEEKGILQPLLVRRLGGGKYELIAGERRYRAAMQIGLDRLPVIVKNVEKDESLELALVENIQRQNLNPVEEALAYKDLLTRYQYTQDELARRVGKDRSTIANALRLLRLPDEVRQAIVSGKISMGHARALVAVEDLVWQQELAQRVIDEGLSVREIEALIRNGKEVPAAAGETTPGEVATENGASVVKIDPRMARVLEALRLHLATKVDLKHRKRRGKILIHYTSEAELNRLLQVIGVQV